MDPTDVNSYRNLSSRINRHSHETWQPGCALRHLVTLSIFWNDPKKFTVPE